MTGWSVRARRRLALAGIVLAVAAIALVRSAALLGYSNWIIDEHFIVAIALGFIGGDLNPHWFNYHPLPMYLLGVVYFVMYLGARLFGLVHSRPEFVALLFGHDAVFYVPAKLLGSFVYTAGAGVLALAAWRRTGSAAAAALAFAAPLLTADGITTGYNVRNDSFVFLFAALTVYFACFARKGPAAALAAVICCAAAFASKVPAIVLAPVLFAQLAYDARRGHLRWRDVGYGALLFPVAAFLFNPFALLDFSGYLPSLHRVSARIGGELGKVGVPTYADTAARLANLGRAMLEQCGPVAVAGSVLYAAWGAVRDRALLFPPLFALAYVTAFITSRLFDVYWLRPVYPFLLLFPILLVAEVASLPWVADRWRGVAGRFGPQGALLTVLVLGYAVPLGANLPMAVEAMVPPPEDTRVTAARWIGQHLPAGSRVVLEGCLPHYWPRVFSPRPEITLAVLQYSYPWVLKKAALVEGFRFWFARALRTERPFEVIPMLSNEGIGYDMAEMRLPAGAYVLLSEYCYRRYYGAEVAASQPQLAHAAQAFFAFVRAQEPVRTFTGNGPTLEIYRMREGLNMAPEPVPAPPG